MTDSFPPTTTYPTNVPVDERNAAVYPTEPKPKGTRKVLAGRSAGEVHAEALKRHPVAYLALALSMVALLWLAIWSSMSGQDNGGFQRVRVGNQDCVSVPQASGPAGLYCRTDAVGT
jgi:hypothetical protein